MQVNNSPLVVAGPSGTGKTYLIEQLAARYPIQLLPSTSTRPPRLSEQGSTSIESLTEAQFKRAEQDGEFILANHLLGHSYGYRRSLLSKVQRSGNVPAVIYFTPIIDQFFTVFPNSFGVFLMPKSTSLLADRMRQRGDAEAEITKRLASMEAEIAAYHRFADLFSVTADIHGDADIYPVIDTIATHYQL